MFSHKAGQADKIIGTGIQNIIIVISESERKNKVNLLKTESMNNGILC